MGQLLRDAARGRQGVEVNVRVQVVQVQAALQGPAHLRLQLGRSFVPLDLAQHRPPKEDGRLPELALLVHQAGHLLRRQDRPAAAEVEMHAQRQVGQAAGQGRAGLAVRLVDQQAGAGHQSERKHVSYRAVDGGGIAEIVGVDNQTRHDCHLPSL